MIKSAIILVLAGQLTCPPGFDPFTDCTTKLPPPMTIVRQCSDVVVDAGIGDSLEIVDVEYAEIYQPGDAGMVGVLGGAWVANEKLKSLAQERRSDRTQLQKYEKATVEYDRNLWIVIGTTVALGVAAGYVIGRAVK